MTHVIGEAHDDGVLQASEFDYSVSREASQSLYDPITREHYTREFGQEEFADTTIVDARPGQAEIAREEFNETVDDVTQPVEDVAHDIQRLIQDAAASAADAATPDWLDWFKWVVLAAVLLYLAKPGLEIGANLTEG